MQCALKEVKGTLTICNETVNPEGVLWNYNYFIYTAGQTLKLQVMKRLCG